MKLRILVLATSTFISTALACAAEPVPENFKRENLVAWCIVPFDAKKRNPAARSEMLDRLGLKRCAYDWRKQHVAEFETEIEEYKDHGIEFFAFWSEHDAAFSLFQKHGITPQVWKTLPSPKADSQEERVAKAVAAMLPLAEKTKALGVKFGLYNHGGWGGQPENLVAVCEALHAKGYDHVGIVYNFHHAHFDLENFADKFAKMKPHLLCLNLNGMKDPDKFDVKKLPDKIVPIGSGELEAGLIRSVIDSGYAGPVGILGHIASEDVEVVLKRNLEGLERLLTK
ncbi:MAG: sugar phosphate isomerase/epimerase [Verrucomicrobiales bacterium]|nr:sugar phosphate isomerase/epimerase [Verrucomicrobiales bacterium]